MDRFLFRHVLTAALVLPGLFALAACTEAAAAPEKKAEAGRSSRAHGRGNSDARRGEDRVLKDAKRMIDQGRNTFRFDTFGDEDFWGRTLRLHEAIEGTALGGVATPDLGFDGVSPRTALAVGLKVDVERLSEALIEALEAGKVDLDSPATTVALLGLNAVVGVTGVPDGNGGLRTIGIQCALCHSTVDDSLAKGIGQRLDGWANRDLDVGVIISLAPDLSVPAKLLGTDQATVRQVLRSWGPGKFDAALLMDGKASDGAKTSATLIPPAFGLAGVNLSTYTGWGSATYWNAFVANLEMHGKGTFHDPRLDNVAKFPVAAANRFGHVSGGADLITPKLAALQFYQLALQPPQPPRGSFDEAAAERGKRVFEGQARCTQCHVPPLFTEPGWNQHTGAEIGIDDHQAARSPDGRYRTAPLRGLFSHAKGGFYHDGRFATLDDVVTHYDTHFGLRLSGAQRADLVQYLLSL
jgi:mono/diheme cytochrome c family protein